MEFKASMDTKTSIITAGVILLLFSLSNLTAVLSGELILNEDSLMGLPLVALLLCPIAYGLSIKSYQITPEKLIVVRPFKNVQFLRTDIRHVVATDKSGIGFAWRLFGSGGFFGYFGRFYSSQLGRFTMYGSQSGNYVVITLAGDKKIVLTPDLPGEFVAALGK